MQCLGTGTVGSPTRPYVAVRLFRALEQKDDALICREEEDRHCQ